jgi:hypothetical protein
MAPGGTWAPPYPSQHKGEAGVGCTCSLTQAVEDKEPGDVSDASCPSLPGASAVDAGVEAGRVEDSLRLCMTTDQMHAGQCCSQQTAARCAAQANAHDVAPDDPGAAVVHRSQGLGHHASTTGGSVHQVSSRVLLVALAMPLVQDPTVYCYAVGGPVELTLVVRSHAVFRICTLSTCTNATVDWRSTCQCMAAGRERCNPL